MIKGSIVALITPMKASGDIDYQSLENLIEFHIENNTQAIVPVGTTGESPTVNNKEHYDIIKKTVELANGRIKVIAGTGSNSTNEAIAQTKAALDFGADACLSVVPYYNKPTQKGIFMHYEAIANSCKLPVILYNVPSRTIADMSNDTTLALAEISNIVGIKDATGDIVRAKDLIARAPKDFAIYSGDDGTAHELILAGGHGVISVTANVAPKQMQAVCEHAMQGEVDSVNAINKTLMALHNAMGIQSNPIPVKWAAYKMGLNSSFIRLPLHILDSEYHQQVVDALTLNNIKLTR